MDELTRAIDSVAKALHPVMKQHGYKKRGRNYRRQGERCTQVLNVQASPWRGRNGTSFTVNLGLYFPVVAVVLWEDTEPSANPSEAECHLRCRLGRLMPRPYDRWWEVTLGCPIDDQIEEVVGAVHDFGVPWLEEHNTLETALLAADPDYLPARESIALWVALGRPEAATPILRTLVERVVSLGREQQAQDLADWGERHGVVIA